MARFVTVAALLVVLTACSHKPTAPPWDDSPEFNNCWSLFPPGPAFQKQMEEYAGTNDPNVIVLGCIPQYRLDKEGCQKFKKVGAGDWPRAVVDWCGEYFDVTLRKIK